jgi:hypothetical protein
LLLSPTPPVPSVDGLVGSNIDLISWKIIFKTKSKEINLIIILMP